MSLILCLAANKKHHVDITLTGLKTGFSLEVWFGRMLIMRSTETHAFDLWYCEEDFKRLDHYAPFIHFAPPGLCCWLLDLKWRQLHLWKVGSLLVVLVHTLLYCNNDIWSMWFPLIRRTQRANPLMKELLVGLKSQNPNCKFQVQAPA